MGSFDGVHRGHQHLLGQLTRLAQGLGGESLVITFTNHPLHYLRPEVGMRLITLAHEKERLIGALGVDRLLMVEFDREIATLTAGEFLALLRDRLEVEHFLIGPDTVIGHDRVHRPEELERLCGELGISLHRTDELRLGGRAVKSSLIREYLLTDRMEEFVRLTGRYFTHTGIVCRGRGQGRERTGFPTLNLPVPAVKLLPSDGVYAGYVIHEGKALAAAINIMEPRFGLSAEEEAELKRLSFPTMPAGTPRLLEAYVIDLALGDLYGTEVTLCLAQKLRDEYPFEGWGKLRDQISRDVEESRDVLKDHPPPDPLGCPAGDGA